MGDTRRISEEYQQIADELIQTREELAYIREADVSIICLASDCEKKNGKKVIYGQCEKIPDKYKWGIPADFTITIFDPNVFGFTEEQLRILILHELYHVGIDGARLYIEPHDCEDFRAIIEEFGVGWSE